MSAPEWIGFLLTLAAIVGTCMALCVRQVLSGALCICKLGDFPDCRCRVHERVRRYTR